MYIHQIFFTVQYQQLPNEYVKSINAWQQLHGFEHRLWNKTSVEELIQSKYPTFESMWTGCQHWIQRIDLARLFMLHTYGGIYCDLDIVPNCTVPAMIDHCVDRGCGGVLAYSESAGLLRNAFMAFSDAINAFLTFVIHRVLHKTMNFSHFLLFPKHIQVMISAGPLMLSMSAKLAPRSLLHHFSIPSELMKVCDYGNKVCIKKSFYFGHSPVRSTWSSSDTAVIEFVWRHRQKILIVLCITLILLLCTQRKRAPRE